MKPGDTVGIAGAGTMGSGIAQVAAASGHPVLIFDTRDGAAARACEVIADGLRKRVERGRMSADDAMAVTSRIQPAESLDAFAPATLIIEAVVEDLKVKHQLFQTLEDIAPEAILATNTSSLSVTAIASCLRHPENLAGLHFFNPAPVMKLVEIVSGLQSSRETLDLLYNTASRWGKLPVHARSTPGFIVNRVARPFYGEALKLLQEQVAGPATLDTCYTGCGGFRMGPFTLMDLIGLDVNYAVTCSVFDAYHGDRRYLPSLIQKELVDAGHLGRKSGRGFYDYSDNHSQVAPDIEPESPAPLRVEPDPSGQPPGSFELDGWILAPSDGRTATVRAAAESLPALVLYDLMLDQDKCDHAVITASDTTPSEAIAAATGFFQSQGKAVIRIDDVAGMVLTRTVAMLINEGADAVCEGVCDASGIDTAMKYGVNYPLGPLEWADRIGVARVKEILDHLYQHYHDPRYRTSPLIRRIAARGGGFH